MLKTGKKEEVQNIGVSVSPPVLLVNCVLVLDRRWSPVVVIQATLIAELKGLCGSANVSLNGVRLAYILVTQAHTTCFLQLDNFWTQATVLGSWCFTKIPAVAPCRDAGRSSVLRNFTRSKSEVERSSGEEDYDNDEGPTCLSRPNSPLRYGEELVAGNIRIVCLHT